MTRSRSLTLLLLLTAGAALALRGPGLNQRPMHNDEAVNAIKFGQLWNHQGYKYDPNEHHGPSLFYFTLGLERLTGAPDLDHFTDARLRWVTVVFGVGLVLLLPLLSDGLGKPAILWAGLFTALSPAFVFYSRYYIHEILLVVFTLLALGSGWRYWRTRKLQWMIAAGVGIGLMAATKETFVITLGAAGTAVALNQVWNRLLDASGRPEKATPMPVWHGLVGFGAALVTALLFLSSFLTNASGPVDSIRTYVPWLNRAAGASPHVHPWYFYLQRLTWFHAGPGPVWTEGLLLVLAVTGAIAGFRRRNLGDANASLIRFISIYALVLAGFYSFLAYKTPWCLLSFWQGAILLAGVGAAVLYRNAGSHAGRVALATFLAIGAGHLGWQCWKMNTSYAEDPRNPYVYAQTSHDLMRLVNQVEALASVDPRHHELVLKVIAPEGDYWPLPWYLRRFNQSGWWDHVPEDPYAPIIIASAKLRAGLDEKKTHLMVGYFELRPRMFLELYVQVDLWKEWLAHHTQME